MRLAQLLASMKRADGRVLIDGFYDDVVPLTEREKQAVSALPAIDADLMRELQFGRPEGGGASLAELLGQPSLNIRGLRSAYVGAQAQNVVPEKAEASIDIRLVKDIQPERQFKRSPLSPSYRRGGRNRPGETESRPSAAQPTWPDTGLDA
jgi:acetylornithine deacetylase/succinyl-diaminopimelate desuccinylase-like protein